jgi:hypothetical protein
MTTFDGEGRQGCWRSPSSGLVVLAFSARGSGPIRNSV